MSLVPPVPEELIAALPGEPVSSQAPDPGCPEGGGQRIVLCPGPESVRAARAFTMRVLSAWGLDDLAAEATIIASELVTNAIRHGAGPESGDDASPRPVELSWQRRDGQLVCTVTDGSSNPPVLAPADVNAESGRGLQIVHGLAATWGWMLLGATSKAVWAALALVAGSLSATG